MAHVWKTQCTGTYELSARTVILVWSGDAYELGTLFEHTLYSL